MKNDIKRNERREKKKEEEKKKKKKEEKKSRLQGTARSMYCDCHSNPCPNARGVCAAERTGRTRTIERNASQKSQRTRSPSPDREFHSVSRKPSQQSAVFPKKPPHPKPEVPQMPQPSS
mmetsp:Transcript_1254/g.3489  ORF Transcript_1254/g.3489 Transcript_1254/m.3489 type:complete len:119 (-) Transcript_1254:232-588(-)